MTVVLGTLAALLFGTGDLIAGVGGRRDTSASGPAGIAVVASVVGAVISGVYWFFSDDRFVGNDLWWAMAGAIAASVARPLLYRGMAKGPIVVFAPVIALVGLIVPVIIGPLVGQPLAPIEIVGLAVALPAVVLVSSSRRLPTLAELRSSPVLFDGTVVGVLIGVMSLCLSFLSTEAGAAPAFLFTSSGIVIVPLVGRLLGMSSRPSATAIRFGATVGCTSVSAFILSTLMFQRGTAAVGSALIGLAPGVSIVLAWKFLNEKIWPIQALGGTLGIITITLFALA